MVSDKTRKKVLYVTLGIVFVAFILGVQQAFSPLEGAKLGPDTIFTVGPVNINNSLIGMWMSAFIVLVFAFFATRKAGIVPTKMQLIAELLIDFFLSKFEDALKSRKLAVRIIPMVLTVFFIILISNQIGFIPFIGSITTENGSLFRTPTSDFSLTIAMALFLVGGGHLIAFLMSPFKAVFNFVKIDQLFKVRKLSDIPNAFLEIFLGVLDIIGEIAKILSISARLFGNLVAGDLMIAIISSLAFFSAYLIPMPFMFLSAFSGVVQAFVFTLLSLLFMAGTINGVRQEETTETN
jgi:F-type H+-transporting ATPase subunit a